MYALAQPTGQITPSSPSSSYLEGMGVSPMPINSISTPQNDADLQSLLQRGAGTIKGLTGQAHQSYSDALYNALSQYAQSNPSSVMAQKALTAAQQNAPAGHSFPKGPATPAGTPPSPVISAPSPATPASQASSLAAGSKSRYAGGLGSSSIQNYQA